jgi:hypothetical protein
VVGRLSLEQVTMVRIHYPQPTVSARGSEAN